MADGWKDRSCNAGIVIMVDTITYYKETGVNPDVPDTQ
jgi:hypothetical protein